MSVNAAAQLHARTAALKHDCCLWQSHSEQRSPCTKHTEKFNGLQQAELERAAQEERSRKAAHEEEERKRKAARQQVKLMLARLAWLKSHKRSVYWRGI